MKQDMCPICTQQFQNKDIVIEYREWNEEIKSEDVKFGHLDCVLYLPKGGRDGVSLIV